MNKELKQNILRKIKINRVETTLYSDTHYEYNLFGRNNRLLMTVECFDGDMPRISITINGEHVAHINHFARTPEQIIDNYDVAMIANRMFDKCAKQKGLVKTTMNSKEYRLSNFLDEFSSKRR